MSLSHADLCEVGRRWLLRSHSGGGPGCRVALVEPPTGLTGGEIPDVIGWRTASACPETYVVEAKTSRSDFRADAGKLHRNSISGMGDYRFYICPEELIAAEDLPGGWGLLWVRPNGNIRHVVNPIKYGSNIGTDERLSEMRFGSVNRRLETQALVSVLWRIGDPNAALEEMREHQRQAQRLARRCDQQAEEIRALRLAFWAKGVP